METPMDTVDLEFFNGKVFMLSGVGDGSVPGDGKWVEDSNYMDVILDNVCYRAMEDPDDGYRSSMKDVQVVTNTVKNVFAPVQVEGRRRPAGRDEDDIIDFYLEGGDEPVLSIGTAATDDYYPCFVADFNPKLLGTVSA